MRISRCIALACALSLAGCAMTPKEFEANRYAMSTLDVCKEWRRANKAKDAAYIQQTQRALAARYIDPSIECERQLAADDKATSDAIAGVAAVALVALVVAAAIVGGGGGSSSKSAVTDTDWDWDLFYNEQGALVWSCRGVQTGRFSELSNCALQPRLDARWPSLQAPK